MKKRRYSEISESSESDNEPQTSHASKAMRVNNHKEPESNSSESSSDSEEKPSSPKKPTAAKPLDVFVAQNPDLTKLELDNLISDDDEVSLLEVPKTIDPAYFVGKTINFDGKTKIKIHKTKYIIEPSYEGVRPISLLTRKLKVVHPVSNLTFREYTKHKHNGESIETGQFQSKLPENLKIRHPLFGAEYQTKVVLDQDIQEKLETGSKKMKKKKRSVEKQDFTADEYDSIEESIFGGKKKKHKKKNKESFMTDTEAVDTDYPEDEWRVKKRKNKSRGLTSGFDQHDAAENQDELILQLLETDTYEKSKKKHKRVHQDDATDSETKPKVGKEPTMKKSKNKSLKYESEAEGDSRKMKVKTERRGSSAEFSEEESSRRKKNKHKTNEEESQVETEEEKPKSRKKTKSLTDQEETDFGTKKKTKGHKTNNIANSTVIPGLQLPLFEFDVSSIMKKEQETDVESSKDFGPRKETVVRKKKKKEKPFEPEYNNFENNDESPGKTKKRKKEKSFDSDSLPLDVKTESFATKSQGSDPECSPKKKRRKIKSENGGEGSPSKSQLQEEDDESNSLIFDILSRVKSEMDNSVKHKTKKPPL